MNPFQNPELSNFDKWLLQKLGFSSDWKWFRELSNCTMKFLWQSSEKRALIQCFKDRSFHLWYKYFLFIFLITSNLIPKISILKGNRLRIKRDWKIVIFCSMWSHCSWKFILLKTTWFLKIIKFTMANKKWIVWTCQCDLYIHLP